MNAIINFNNKELKEKYLSNLIKESCNKDKEINQLAIIDYNRNEKTISKELFNLVFTSMDYMDPIEYCNLYSDFFNCYGMIYKDDFIEIVDELRVLCSFNKVKKIMVKNETVSILGDFYNVKTERDLINRFEYMSDMINPDMKFILKI